LEFHKKWRKKVSNTSHHFLRPSIDLYASTFIYVQIHVVAPSNGIWIVNDVMQVQKMSRIFILAFDGLEYYLVKEWKLRN